MAPFHALLLVCVTYRIMFYYFRVVTFYIIFLSLLSYILLVIVLNAPHLWFSAFPLFTCVEYILILTSSLTYLDVVLVLSNNIFNTLVGEIYVSFLPILGPGKEEAWIYIFLHLIEVINTWPYYLIFFKIIVRFFSESLAPLLFRWLKYFSVDIISVNQLF